MRQHLGVHHVALTLLTGLVHGLWKEEPVRVEGTPIPFSSPPPELWKAGRWAGVPEPLTCVSLTVALLGANGLVSVMV